MLKKILILLTILIIAFIARLFMSGNKSQTMSFERSKIETGKLTKCKSDMNCYEGTIDYGESVSKLKKIIQTDSSNTLKVDSTNYLYFENKSLIFGFIDDIEFLLDESLKKLHYRSSSRVGKSDMGANKKRIDRILSELRL
jgi:uncharacterized protein (DUF1499 family)